MYTFGWVQFPVRFFQISNKIQAYTLGCRIDKESARLCVIDARINLDSLESHYADRWLEHISPISGRASPRIIILCCLWRRGANSHWISTSSCRLPPDQFISSCALRHIFQRGGVYSESSFHPFSFPAYHLSLSLCLSVCLSLYLCLHNMYAQCSLSDCLMLGDWSVCRTRCHLITVKPLMFVFSLLRDFREVNQNGKLKGANNVNSVG